MPLGGTRVPVSTTGEVAPGVLICDSASFPDLPAVSAPSPPRATFELWPFIAALAFGLLALEWLHYVRRA